MEWNGGMERWNGMEWNSGMTRPPSVFCDDLYLPIILRHNSSSLIKLVQANSISIDNLDYASMVLADPLTDPVRVEIRIVGSRFHEI